MNRIVRFYKNIEYANEFSNAVEAINWAKKRIKHYEKMPRRKRSKTPVRGRTRAASSYPTPSKRRSSRYSRSRSMSTSRFRAPFRLPYRRLPNIKRKRALRRPCNLWKKPPRKFVKKVESVISRNTPCANFDYFVYSQHILNNTLAIQNNQFTWDGIGSLNLNFFGFNQVNDAAAIMFKNKTPTVNSNTTVSGNFDNDAKIVVDNQYVSGKIVNNFQTGGTIKIVTCFPKGDTDVKPIDQWNDAKASYKMITNVTAPVEVFQPKNSQWLYDMPTKYHGFNSVYTANVVQKHLKPGETFSYIRYGKCGVYDNAMGKDLTSDLSYKLNVKGYNQWLMFIWVPDLIQSSNSNRVIQHSNSYSTSTILPCLMMEYHYHACIRAPAETDDANRTQVNGYFNYADVSGALLATQKASRPFVAYNTGN